MKKKKNKRMNWPKIKYSSREISEEPMLNIKDLKIPEYKLTEEEKEIIFNKLKKLLKNPNMSIRVDSINNVFIKYKFTFKNKMELEWYRIAEDFIRILENNIMENKEKVYQEALKNSK